MTAPQGCILLSFDIEDWFHSSNMEQAVPKADWAACSLRVAPPTRLILDLLDEHDLKATFFVLGWSAQRDPQLIREIDARGHEVACHGYGHDVLTRLDAESFNADLTQGLDAIGMATGKLPVGYRAPSFSITEWALDVLAERGFLYDSSYHPVPHDRYGKVAVDAQRVSEARPGLLEVPISVLRLGRPVPWAGGGYFRLLPYALFEPGVRRILRQAPYYLYYLHPWELDPEQPKATGLSWARSARHRVGLHETEGKLRRFLAFAAGYRVVRTMDFVREHKARNVKN